MLNSINQPHRRRREIDAQIAERIMGFVRVIRDTGAEPLPPDHAFLLGRGTFQQAPTDMPLVDVDLMFDVPEYSSDPTSAFQVVDALKSRKAYVSCLYQLTDTCWVCDFLQDGEHTYRGLGDRPALAICRAALQVVSGVKHS